MCEFLERRALPWAELRRPAPPIAERSEKPLVRRTRIERVPGGDSAASSSPTGQAVCTPDEAPANPPHCKRIGEDQDEPQPVHQVSDIPLRLAIVCPVVQHSTSRRLAVNVTHFDQTKGKFATGGAAGARTQDRRIMSANPPVPDGAD